MKGMPRLLRSKALIGKGSRGTEGGTLSDLSNSPGYLWGYFPPFRQGRQGK